MKVKTALIILFSILALGLIGLSATYFIKKNQPIADADLQQEEVVIPEKVLTPEEKKEQGKARAAELLRMMDQTDGASSTPLTEEEKLIKIREGEARAAQLLKMMR